MVDFSTVVERISDSTVLGGPLWQLVGAFCYFMALVFAMSSFMQMKEASEGGGRMTYKAAVLTFFAAAILAAAPSAIKSVAVSIYGGATDRSPLSSIREGVDADLRSFRALMQFVSIMGYMFFVRGIFVLKQAGQPERYPHSSGLKATMILVSGMAAIYIDLTLSFVASITGWDVSKYLGN